MAELHARVEKLESLKDQMQAVRLSIAKAVSDGPYLLTTTLIPFDQEMLNIELEKLGSMESVDSHQVATATSYKEWFDIKPKLFSSGKALRKVYYNQGELRRCDHQIDLNQICQI